MVNLIILYVLVGMIGLSLIIGGIESFWNLIDLTQMLLYLGLINTTLPYNLNFLLNLFELTSLRIFNQMFDFSNLIVGTLDLDIIQNYSVCFFSEKLIPRLLLFNTFGIFFLLIIAFLAYLLCRPILWLINQVSEIAASSTISERIKC